MRALLFTLPLLFSSPALATVLYSGAALPTAEGWSSVTAGSIETQLPSGVRLDTTASPLLQGGYFRILPPNTLSKVSGFQLNFTLAVASEEHAANPVRAGTSVIVLTSDHTGIELAFQGDTIFAQNEGFLTAGEAASFATGALTDYAIAISGDSYTLAAAGSTLLTGSLRDYSATVPQLGPIYSTPNFLFFGDDTSSARSITTLASVTLVPEPAGIALLLPAVALLGRRRTMRA